MVWHDRSSSSGEFSLTSPGTENPGQVKWTARFFADFELPKSLSAIEGAVQWDSDQMLHVHAFRVLMGTAAAHTGNVLVNQSGKLFSIDHELTYRGHGELLNSLSYLHPSSRAAQAVRDVASLEPGDIETAFETLPDCTWPLGSKQETVIWFGNRLKLFKRIARSLQPRAKGRLS